MVPDPSRLAAAGVVIPIRAFAVGKARLSETLEAAPRAELAEWMADQVLAAAGPLPVVIVSSADDVRAWAARHAVPVLDDPGDLDRSAATGVAWCRARGLVRAIVAHADLPRAPVDGLVRFASDGAQPIVTVVPCHRDDGSPVIAVPIESSFEFAYGPGSFRRHLAHARRAGLAVRVVRDPLLGFDVDLPSDLAALDRDRAMTEAEPLSTDRPVPLIALAIGAHPDDIEFGCGATLAKWAASGAAVHLLILTDGSKGSWDEADDLGALIDRRQLEAREAARRLGAASVRFLGLVDGELESGPPERALVCEVIREIKPTIVLGHDPWKRYRLHPDHRHAGWLTVDGIVAARDPHFFPGLGGPHHRPDGLLLFEADEPDHLELVEAFIPMKIDALLAHRSQWRSTMGIEAGTESEATGHAAFAARIDAQARDDGKLGSDGPAEAFRAINDV